MYLRSIYGLLFLSILLSVNFNYGHEGRFLLWHIQYQGENVSRSVGFVILLFKCPICQVVVLLACLSVWQVFVQGWS